MSEKIFWYGPDFIQEYGIREETALLLDNELYNRERAADEQRQLLKGEKFPPTGYRFDRPVGLLIELTLEEKHREGLIELAAGQKIEAGEIREKSATEKLIDGVITLEQFRRFHCAQIEERYDQHVAQVLDRYRPAERAGWDLKYLEASKWKEADANERVQLRESLSLIVEATERVGADEGRINALVDRILNKASSWQKFLAEATGRKDRLKDQIAATSGSDLKKVAADIEALAAGLSLPELPAD